MADIPYSKTYLHNLKELYTQREENIISDEVLNQRSFEQKRGNALIKYRLKRTN